MQVAETALTMVYKEGAQNPSMVVVETEVPSGGMNRIHESDNSDFDKNSDLPLVPVEPSP